MRQLEACIRKDIKEFLRKKKLLFSFIILIVTVVMVILATVIIPVFIEILMDNALYMINDAKDIKDLLINFFPHSVSDNLAFFSTEMGLFYTIYIVFACHGVIPKEIKSGKWILPVNMGIKTQNMIKSKCIVYGLGMGLPVLITYNLFYFISALYLNIDCSFVYSVFNSFILLMVVFAITVVTILLSIIYKHSIIAGITVLVFIIVTPDIMEYFSFGKYMPTYLLTYVFYSKNQPVDLIIPTIILICLIAFIYKIASGKKIKY